MKHKNDPIAVIGLGCVYPGAHSPEELWQNVLAGRRYFRVAPDVRLPREDYFDSNKYAPGKTYCDKMAVITDWEFDPLEFHIPPVSVYTSDIAHWLALYTAREAIKDSGLNLDEIDRTKVGVIIGNTLTGEFSRSHNLMFRWPYVERSIRKAFSGAEKTYVDSVVDAIGKIYKAPLPEITEDSLPGNMSNTIAGRICNSFDFGGGCYTVDGACSSSLLSIAHACSSLVDGEMDMVVAGGVDVSLDPFEVVGFAKTTALSADDIKPYDEHAEGLLPGEGCGIVLLTKESFAKKIGAKIYAVIPGWGYSSDGSAGITAPEVEGQMRALQKAYNRAGYSISDVQLIEGHGTGTSLGDKVEVNAIMRLLEQNDKNSVCRIGSIKSNIGHCKASAGAAAFIKAVMALENKIIPPTTNCDKPNASFGTPLNKLVPALKGIAWEKTDSPRRASVSAMGFGGANSHITIEEANPNGKPKKEELELLRSGRKTELILFSAETEDKLMEKIKLVLPVAAKICRAELTDLSAELAKNIPVGEIRVAIVTDSPWNLHDKLTKILSQLNENGDVCECDDSQNGIFAGKTKENPKFFALFPGQGSQRINMCSELVNAFPFLENIYDEAGENIRKIIFRDAFAANDTSLKSWEEKLKQTGNSQPAIVLSSLAILKTLSFFRLKPDISIGHSLGEITALAAAGAYDDRTAMKIAVARGKTMATAKSDEPGAMLAIAANAEKVEKLLADYKGKLNIANYNSPVQTVVTGTSDSIDKLAKQCKEQKTRCIKLPVSNAFHS
ncbi:type I polyketide synthase, partial [bacterium]|nr:type I polyketide synthase [bacterium]